MTGFQVLSIFRADYMPLRRFQFMTPVISQFTIVEDSMNRTIVHLALLVCVVCRNANAEPPFLVGELGTPERIIFVGSTTFSQKQLRDGVEENFDSIVAGHPAATLSSFLKVIKAQVEAGFQNCGFPDVVVQSKYDESQSAIVVSIDEGIRCRRGAIEIEGAIKLPVDRIRDFLTRWNSKREPKLPFVQDDTTTTGNNVTAFTKIEKSDEKAEEKEYPIWEVGKPVSFSELYRSTVETALKRCFQNFGYFDTNYSVRVRKEENHTATLVVTIHDEGPAAVLGETQVVGNVKNSSDAFVKFLGLTEGMPLNSEVTAEIQQKLHASARFLKYEVEVISPPFGDGRSVLKISVYESPNAPPLDEAFSQEIQAALRAGRWFESLTSSEDDIYFSSLSPPKAESKEQKGELGCDVKVVVNPRQQRLFVAVKILSSLKKILFEGTVTANAMQVTFDTSAIKAQFVVPVVSSRLHALAKFNAYPPDKKGNCCRTFFGFGRTNTHDGTSSLIAKVVVDPSAVIQFLAKSTRTARLEENSLVFTDEYLTARFDAESGCLQDVTPHDESGSQLKIRIVPGLLDELHREHARSIENWKVVRLDDSLFASTTTGTPVEEDGRSVDQQATAKSTDDFFVIPPNTKIVRGLTNIGFSAYLPYVRIWVPAPSWAWTLAREFIFSNTGHSLHSYDAVKSLMESPETGPLAHLTGAYLFGFLYSDLKADLAKRGVEKLEVQDFQYDYKPFLREDTRIGKVMIILGKLLQECDEAEIRVLVDTLVPHEGPERDTLFRAMCYFPQHHDQPPLKVIPKVLDELWQPIIRPHVEKWLSECGMTSPTAAPRVTNAEPGKPANTR